MLLNIKLVVARDNRRQQGVTHDTASTFSHNPLNIIS